MTKKPEPKISKPQKICLDALNSAVNDGEISQEEADPIIAKCSSPLAPSS
jgi:hypothetical protein